MRLKESVFNIYQEADAKFNPKRLCNYLQKDTNCVVYVDRAKAIQSDNDNRLFAVTMNYVYGWGYSDFENSTIYLSAGDNCIIGGIYNLQSRQIVTKRVVAESVWDRVPACYNYSKETMKDIFTAICNA